MLSITRRLNKNEKFSVLYVDLDNFKPYNDKYGYKMGDKVLVMTAKVLQEAVNEFGNNEDFVGHIGGDDFVIITTPANDVDISQKIINNFDEKIKKFFNHQDRIRGYIVAKDRQGNKRHIPLTSISIAIVSNKNKEISNHLQVSDIAAELKKFAKKTPRSNYVRDKRIS